VSAVEWGLSGTAPDLQRNQQRTWDNAPPTGIPQREMG
jgi:hypothetical protein